MLRDGATGSKFNQHDANLGGVGQGAAVEQQGEGGAGGLGGVQTAAQVAGPCWEGDGHHSAASDDTRSVFGRLHQGGGVDTDSVAGRKQRHGRNGRRGDDGGKDKSNH